MPSRRSEPTFLIIGRVEGAWGLKGEMKVKVLTDFPERFKELRRVYLTDGSPREVAASRVQGRWAILRLADCHDRRLAQTLRGQFLRILREEAVSLPKGKYYVHQIMGLGVWTTGGEYLGQITDVLFTGSNDVYVIRGEKGEILIPAIQAVVKEIDLEGERLLIEPMGGLF